MSGRHWAALLCCSIPLLAGAQTPRPAVAAAGTSVALPAAATVAPDPQTLLALPPALRARFQQDVLAAGGSQKLRLERIVEFVFAETGLGITYEPEATYTLDEAYRTRKANCLTFTMMVVALAREAGLTAFGQAIDNTLAWHREGTVVYRTNHVNAGVMAGQRRLGVDVAQDSVMMQRLPDPIEDERLLAMYYNNRAIALGARGEHAAAAEHMAMSLKLDPTYATSWGNSGVLHARAGDVAAAERAYLRALELDSGHAATLTNISALYQRQGQADKAARYRTKLARVQAADPFHHFELAVAHEERQAYAQAAHHYRRAIVLHDKEHRFHFGLARSLLHLGEPRQAEKALARAHELSRGDTQGRYLAKLERLRSQGH